MVDVLIYAEKAISNYFTFFIRSLLLLENSRFVTYDNREDVVIEDDKIYIFLQLLDSKFYGKRNVLLFNTEQLTVEMSKNHASNVLGNNIIIDYSHENIQWLKRYLAVGEEDYVVFPPIRHETMLYNIPDKTYDIAFIGGMTQRREKILEKLGDYDVLVITYRLDGEHMFMPELLKAKVLLNIHAYEDRRVTETIRCYPCMFNGMIVVSEESYDMSVTYNHEPCSKYIHFADYNSLVHKCSEVLRDYDELSQCLTQHYDEFDSIGREYLTSLKSRLSEIMN